jgi:hypothetical protein
MFEPDMIIAFLGACGGSKNLDGVNTLHAIATKRTGTMEVNDAMLKRLNELILTGKDFTWEEYWAGLPAELRKNEDFENYVPPDENFEQIFRQALRQRQQKLQEKHLPTNIPEGLVHAA